MPLRKTTTCGEGEVKQIDIEKVRAALETLSDILLKETAEKNLGGLVRDIHNLGYRIVIKVSVEKERP